MSRPRSPTDPFAAWPKRNDANFVALTPITFLAKAAQVHPDRLALVYNDARQSWSETYARCRRLAAALALAGITRGDTVSVLLPNTPPMYEAHFAVPMVGAVLNTLNTRIDVALIAFQLRHAGTKLLIADGAYGAVVEAALARLDDPPRLVVANDPYEPGGRGLAGRDYEDFLAEGDPGYLWRHPEDECDPIALSYTSGTTGDPKGVVTNHRGAYLNAIGQILSWDMPDAPVYLWTLPMFHCNGWCFPWAVAAKAGVNVCLRGVVPPIVIEQIRRHSVTHMSGAPIVYDMLIGALESGDAPLRHTVKAMLAGAAPTTRTLHKGKQVGFDITHVYGLTEVYGPAAICTPRDEWRGAGDAERVRLNARQGVANIMQESMIVADPKTLRPVPADGETLGEIMFRGNVTMSGYLENPAATEAAFAGGWFHTGDLAVMELDGYARITDRSKDIIISGGENVSSLEVEEVLSRHPSVAAVAVVAKSDEHWGEVPCAFVELVAGQDVTARELQGFCRDHLARYKVPKAFVFGPIPRTATGKIPKFELRSLANKTAASTPPPRTAV